MRVGRVEWLADIGQSIARNVTSITHMAPFAPLGITTFFNVPKAIRIGNLYKCHKEILIKISEVLDFVISSISLEWTCIHHLEENKSACLYVLLPPGRVPRE